jgi:hypothetical protein
MPCTPEQCVVLLCSLVEHARVNGCCQQVVGCADGVDVTGQVQVQLLHGDHLQTARDGQQAVIGIRVEFIHSSVQVLGRECHQWVYIQLLHGDHLRTGSEMSQLNVNLAAVAFNWDHLQS